MRPRFVMGWAMRELAAQLQRFYIDLMSGARPKLLIVLPPQHGKSLTVIDFLAWIAGVNPDIRTIFSSFSDRLGVRANLQLQRMFGSPDYHAVFPNTRIATATIRDPSAQWTRNREFIEFVGRDGYFRNTTVDGPVTGESLDLGVIDDPIKGAKTARSKAVRDSTWDWLLEDFLSRFSDHAGFVMTCTRWHLDDPAGRMIEHFPDARVIHYPALAVTDEEHRAEGDPLFPEIKPREFLLERKAVMTSARWNAVYQGNPVREGGNLIKAGMIGVLPAAPASIVRSVRYWDKAATEGGGDYSAGVRIDTLHDGRFLIRDVRRGQWSTGQREKTIKQTAELDDAGKRKVPVWIEREPGSSGKDSATATTKSLAGHIVHADSPTGPKEARAEPFAAQVEAGNVVMLQADWNQAYIDELSAFPNGENDDQVDASSGAFNKLTGGKRAEAW